MIRRRASRTGITASLGLEGDAVTIDAVTRWLGRPPDRSWLARAGVGRRALAPLCLVYSGVPAEASLARHLGAVVRKLRGKRLPGAVSASARATVSAGRRYRGTASLRLVDELAMRLEHVDVDLLLEMTSRDELRTEHRYVEAVVHSVRGRELGALRREPGRLGVLDGPAACALGLSTGTGGIVSIMLRSTCGQMGVRLTREFLRALSSSSARLVLDARTVESE